ncbi:MAG: hypothetical protein AB1609_22610 [Bacillota bacterium]
MADARSNSRRPELVLPNSSDAGPFGDWFAGAAARKDGFRGAERAVTWSGEGIFTHNVARAARRLLALAPVGA